MPDEPPGVVVVPRPVRRTGRTGGGWPEGLGPELHELLFDASALLTPDPRPVNGEWFTEYTLSADRVGTSLRWARKMAARQADCGLRKRTLAAIDDCLAGVDRFPRWRADTLALIAADGPDVVRVAFATWWAGMVATGPELERCVAEIERTGWGLEPEGGYRVHVRVWGRAVWLGDAWPMSVGRLLYRRGDVPRGDFARVVWGRSEVKPATLRSAVRRLNEKLVDGGQQWGRVRLGRGGVRLEILPRPP